MSCISVKINRISNSPIFEITRIGESIKGEITPLIDPLIIKHSILRENVNINIKAILTTIKVNCSIVCNVSKDAYMKISPSEVQWLSPDWYIVYEVKSNTDWIVE